MYLLIVAYGFFGDAAAEIRRVWSSFRIAFMTLAVICISGKLYKRRVFNVETGFLAKRERERERDLLRRIRLLPESHYCELYSRDKRIRGFLSGGGGV